MTELTGGPVQATVLTWDLWCGSHLEPYGMPGADGVPPLGAATALVKLYNTGVAAGWDKSAGPICCFLPAGALDQIYADTLPSRGRPMSVQDG